MPAQSRGDDRMVVGPGEVLRVEAPAGDRVEVALDGGVFRPLDGPLKAPASGEHWLALVSRDALGAVSPLRWIHLVVDGEPPECRVSLEPSPVEHPAGSLWARPGTVVSLSARDSGAGPASVELVTNGVVTATGERRASGALESDGKVLVGGTCRDAVGNTADAATVELTLDGSAPQGELHLNGRWLERDGRFIAEPGIGVSVRWVDAGSGVAETRISRDGQWRKGSELSGAWTEGEHQVEAQARDRVGNEAVAGPLALVIDGTPPVVRCSSETPAVRGPDTAGEAWLPTGSRLVCEAEDAVAGVESLKWSADGRSWHLANGEVPLTEVGVQVRAMDRVGNVQEISPPYRVDTLPPKVEIVSPARGSWPGNGEIVLRRGQSLAVRASDGQSGIVRVEYRIDGAPWSAVRKRVTFRDAGEFTLEIRATDRAGNVALVRRRVLVVRGADGGY